MHFNSIIRTFCRLALGLLFVFSGYVKAIDPMGSAIKFGEYFEAFHMSALEPGALFFGILLAQAELLIGLAFLFGMRMKLASWGGLLFMVFFSCLTFVLAKTDAVRDCGCFGDAVKLTNWQTFYKNIVILPFMVYVFFQRKSFKPLFSDKVEWGMALTITLFCTGISIYTYRHLPFIDFMPYKVGVNLPEVMVMPEGAPTDEYESTFIYQKDGVNKEFKVENLPDTSWTWVETKSKLVKKGYTPPAGDFTISDSTGTYVQHDVLAHKGFLLFLTSPDGAEIKHNKASLIKEIYSFAQAKAIPFLFLSGSASDINKPFIEEVGTSLPQYHTDNVVLKSMVRSNPGLMLLKDGVILQKWNNRDFPSANELEQLVSKEPKKVIEANKAATARINIVLGIITALLFMAFSIKRMTNCKKKKTRFE